MEAALSDSPQHAHWDSLTLSHPESLTSCFPCYIYPHNFTQTPPEAAQTPELSHVVVLGVEPELPGSGATQH